MGDEGKKVGQGSLLPISGASIRCGHRENWCHVNN